MSLKQERGRFFPPQSSPFAALMWRCLPQYAGPDSGLVFRTLSGLNPCFYFEVNDVKEHQAVLTQLFAAVFSLRPPRTMVAFVSSSVRCVFASAEPGNRVSQRLAAEYTKSSLSDRQHCVLLPCHANNSVKCSLWGARHALFTLWAISCFHLSRFHCSKLQFNSNEGKMSMVLLSFSISLKSDCLRMMWIARVSHHVSQCSVESLWKWWFLQSWIISSAGCCWCVQGAALFPSSYCHDPSSRIKSCSGQVSSPTLCFISVVLFPVLCVFRFYLCWSGCLSCCHLCPPAHWYKYSLSPFVLCQFVLSCFCVLSSIKSFLIALFMSSLRVLFVWTLFIPCLWEALKLCLVSSHCVDGFNVILAVISFFYLFYISANIYWTAKTALV